MFSSPSQPSSPPPPATEHNSNSHHFYFTPPAGTDSTERGTLALSTAPLVVPDAVGGSPHLSNPLHPPPLTEEPEQISPAPSSDTTGTKNNKPSRTSPPRPPNAFILYRKDQSSEFLRSKTGKSVRNGDVSKLIGEMWKNESENVRKSYYLKAAEAKRVHAEKYPKYKYRPARGVGGGGGGGKHRVVPSSQDDCSNITPSNPADPVPNVNTSYPEPPPPLPPPPDVLLSRRVEYYPYPRATTSEPLSSSPSVSPGPEHDVTYGAPNDRESIAPVNTEPLRFGNQQPHPVPDSDLTTDTHDSFFDFPSSSDPPPPPTSTTSNNSDTARTIAARLIQNHPEIQAVLAEAYLTKYLENRRWEPSFHPEDIKPSLFRTHQSKEPFSTQNE